MLNELFPSFLCQIERILCAFNLFERLTWLRKYDVIDCSFLALFSRCSFIYLVTSSGAEENVGRIGTSLTSGRTSDPDDARTTAERATLSEP